MNNHRKIVDKILTVFWVVALVLVLFKIYEYASPVWDRISNVNTIFAVIGIIFGLFCSFPSVWVVRNYFSGFNKNNSWSIAFFLTFLPALGKYIPGKIWAAGSFVLHASNLANVTVSESMVFQIYYQVVGITATTLLVVFGYLFGFEIILSIEFLVIFILVLVSCLGLSLLLSRYMKQYKIKLRTDKFLHHVMALVIQKILKGICLVIFISSVVDIDAYAVIILFAFFIAMQIGVLAFFAPAGLGITEGVYMIILSPVVGPEIAITVTLLSRIWNVLLDTILAMMALFVRNYRLRTQPDAL